ncbi:unnamed protein product, partial [Ectocarpus fasciculatus]
LFVQGHRVGKNNCCEIVHARVPSVQRWGQRGSSTARTHAPAFCRRPNIKPTISPTFDQPTQPVTPPKLTWTKLSTPAIIITNPTLSATPRRLYKLQKRRPPLSAHTHRY